MNETDTDNLPQTATADQLPAELHAMLAEAAKEKAAAETNSDNIPFLSLKGKRFTLNEEKLGTELDVVILADLYDNSYYDRPYKEGVQVPPACFAINSAHDALAPHEASPVKQSDDCATCPKNEWGSSQNGSGKGKACRNGRRLLVAPYIRTTGAVSMGELAIVNLAPTTLTSYSEYLRKLPKVGLPLPPMPMFAVATHLSFDDDRAYPVLKFEKIDNLTDPNVLGTIMSQQPKFLEVISTPYNVADYTPPEEGSASRSKMS